MAETALDLIGPKTRASFPPDSFPADVQAWLNRPAPAAGTPERRALVSAMAAKLPEWLERGRAERAKAATPETTAAAPAAPAPAATAPKESDSLLKRAASGFLGALPAMSVEGVPLPSAAVNPGLWALAEAQARAGRFAKTPTGTAGKIAQTAGGIVGYGLTAAGVTAALPARVALAAAGRALAGGAPVLAQPGTAREKIVGAGVMALASAAVGPLADFVAAPVMRAIAKQAPEFAAGVERHVAETYAEGLASKLTPKQAGERAVKSGLDMLSRGAQSAATARQAAKLTGVAVASGALFGAAAPVTETAIRKATGENIEWPSWQETAQSAGGLALLSAVTGVGVRRGAKRSAPEGVAEPPGAGPAQVGTAPAAPQPPTPAPAEPRVALPAGQIRVVRAILRGLDSTAPNPLDHGRTASRGAQDRFYALLPENPTDAQVREAASRARAQAKGVQAIADAIRDPGPPDPASQQASLETSTQLLETLGGKKITMLVDLPGGTSGRPEKSVVTGTVVRAVNFPYSGLPQQTRVTIVDATGKEVPFYFRDVAALHQAIVPEGAGEMSALMQNESEQGAPTRTGGQTAASAPTAAAPPAEPQTLERAPAPTLTLQPRGGPPGAAVPPSAPGLREGVTPEPALPAETQTVRAQSLHFHKPFQQRDIPSGVIDEAHALQLAEKYGGYSQEEGRRNPIVTWVDRKGEIGPEGRVYVLSGHHRTYVAQHEWVDQEGKLHRGGTSDRDVAVAPFEGTYAQALNYADTSNFQGKPNTLSEQAGVVKRLTDRGLSLREVARQAAGGSEAKARQLLDLGHVDDELRRQYFGEQGLPAAAGAHIGALVREYRIAPVHQRSWLARLADGRISSLPVLKGVTEFYIEVLKRTQQLDLLSKADMGPGAISPDAASDYMVRAVGHAVKARAKASGAVRALKDLLKRPKVSKAEVKAGELLLNRFHAEAKLAEKLKNEAQARFLQALQKPGGSLVDAAAEVGRWVDQQLGEWTPADEMPPPVGGSLSAFGVSGLHEALVRGVPRAMQRLWQRIPRAERDLRFVDEHGNTVKRVAVQYEQDAWSDYASSRLMARSGVLATGQDILPPSVRAAHAIFEAQASDYANFYREAAALALGPAGMRYARQYGVGDFEIEKALRGQPHAVPKQFAPMLAKLRQILDVEFMTEAHDLLERGYSHHELPARLENYLPQRAGPVPKNIVEFFGKIRARASLPAAELDELWNRFLEHRVAPEGEAEGFWSAFMRRTNAHVNWMAKNHVVDAINEYLGSEEALRDQNRAALVRTWAETWIARKPGVLHQWVDNGMRWLTFARGIDGTLEVSQEHAAALAGLDLTNREDARLWRTVKPTTGGGASRVPYQHYVYVKEGASIGIPTHDGEPTYHAVGTTPHGGTIYAGPVQPGAEGAMIHASGAPDLRTLFKLKNFLGTKARVLMQREWNVPEAHVREAIAARSRALAMYHNPAASLASYSRSTVRALVGWNPSTITKHTLQNFVTVIPEHGFVNAAQGFTGAVGKFKTNALLREIDRWEASGHLTAEQAEHFRALIPLTAAHFASEALGPRGFEGFSLEETARSGKTRGEAPWWRTPLGPLHAVLSFQRA